MMVVMALTFANCHLRYQNAALSEHCVFCSTELLSLSWCYQSIERAKIENVEPLHDVGPIVGAEVLEFEDQLSDHVADD